MIVGLVDNEYPSGSSSFAAESRIPPTEGLLEIAVEKFGSGL